MWFQIFQNFQNSWRNEFDIFLQEYIRLKFFLTHYNPRPHFDAQDIYIAVENIVRKGEIACDKQFLLFSQCFLPYMVLIFHFECTLECRLQFVSICTSL